MTIVNKGISSETIGVQDMTVEHCDTVEVAELFTIDDTAGEARYEIVEGGTGKGILDGTKLTVEQPGTFIIKVTVEKEGQEALEAMATIEVRLPDIEEVTPPEITSDKLESYYEDAGAVIAVLPTKVAVSTDTGMKEMKIIWYCQSYDKRPNASNTFVWVIDPKEYEGYDMNGKEIYGEITFQNMMMLGDINSDGTVDLTDLMKCLYHVSGSATLSGGAFAAADVNEDGTVDLTDLMKILYYVSGSISEF